MPIAALVLARPNEARTISKILEGAGCVTRSAASLDEAIKALTSFRPQLAVTDWPLVVNDPRLIMSLRKRCPGLKVIMLAPLAWLVDARDFLNENEDVIPHPVDPDALQSALERARGGKAASLVASLLAIPGRFLSRAKAGRREQGVHLAERERSRVFQGLHTAIRSKAIDGTAGLEVWDRIAQLELSWAQLKADSEAAQPAFHALAEGYQQLFERMTAMAQSGAVGSLRKRESGEVDLTGLQCLFERVREGLVSPEQFQEAWTVWSLSPEEREKNELFMLMWEPKRRKSGGSQRMRRVQPAATMAADLIDTPTDSKKIKRVKAPGESQRMRAVKPPGQDSGEGRSTESQRMRKLKRASAEAETETGPTPAAEPAGPAPAAPSEPEPAGPGPNESQRRRKVKPPSQPGAAAPVTPAPAPGMALGAPIPPAPQAPQRPKFVRKTSVDNRPTL